MNAAILLMGSAWMAGADTAPPVAAPHAAVPHAAAPHASAPHAAAPGGPVTVNTGAGCVGCGSHGPVVSSYGYGGDCNPCASTKHGLFSRLGGRSGGGLFGGKHKQADCCTPAPSCCATAAPVYQTPVYTGFTTACCDPCAGSGGGLFSKLKGRFGKKGGDCCDTGCGGTAYGAGYGYSGVAATPCATPLPAGAAPVVSPPAGYAPPAEMPKPPTTTPNPIPNPTPKATPKAGSGAALTPAAPITPVAGPSPSGTTSPY